MWISRRQSHDQPIAAPGFSILELMISVSILAVISVMLLFILDRTTRATVSSTSQRSSDNQARLVFGRLATDADSMVRRDDLEVRFEKSTGNDQLYFLSRVNGYDGQRELSLVGYRVTQQLQLERLGVGLNWDQVPFMPDRLETKFPEIGGSSPDYQPLSDQVIRLELAFEMAPNETHKSPYFAVAAPGDNWRNVRGLLVCLAVVDRELMAKLTPAQLEGISRALPDAQESTTEVAILKTWDDLIATGSLESNLGVPVEARRGVRTYQRLFPLN